jgi:hypothetical protein
MEVYLSKIADISGLISVLDFLIQEIQDDLTNNSNTGLEPPLLLTSVNKIKTKMIIKGVEALLYFLQTKLDERNT